MLPSRGVSSVRSAFVARHSNVGVRQSPPASLRLSTRQFSQVSRLGQSTPAWSTTSAALRGQSSTSPRSALLKSIPLARASGATRSLSLWGFGSKPTNTIEDTLRPQSTTASAAKEPTPSPDLAASSSDTLAAAPAPETASLSSVPSSSIPNGESLSPDFSAESLAELEASILDIPEQIGYLKQLGLDFGWGPSSMCEWILEHVYIYTGLPWWATICATAFAIRAALFWPTAIGMKHAARMAMLQKTPEYIQAQNEMKQLLYDPNADRMEAMVARQKVSKMHKAAGASMLKTLAGPMAIIPLSYGMFRVLRAMGSLPVPSLESGGLAWITDLSVYDPTYVLPLVTAAISFYTIKLHQASNMNPTPQGEAMGKIMAYALTPFMFLCTMWFPAACQLFFFAFAVASVGQQKAVLNPTVRQWFDLPPLAQRPLLPSTGPSGIQYQAPSRGLRGMLDGASKNVDHVKNGIKDLTGGDAKIAATKAAEYEKRRAQEEKDKMLQRAVEQRRRKSQNK